MCFKVLFVVAALYVAVYSNDLEVPAPVTECRSCLSRIPGDECHAGGKGINVTSCREGTIRCVTITGEIKGRMGMIRACSSYEDCSTFTGYDTCIVCNWEGCNDHRL